MSEDSFDDPRFGRSILYTFLPEPNNNITDEEEVEGDLLVSSEAELVGISRYQSMEWGGGYLTSYENKHPDYY